MQRSLLKKIRSTFRQYQKGEIRPFVRKQLSKLLPASDLIWFDILERPHYAYGLLVAFDEAHKLGHKRITAIELGVGDGGGLKSLCKAAASLTNEFGIQCDIVGFDSGQGLPAPQGYKDHPEIWSEGHFVPDKKQLAAELPANARVIYGDVQETVPQFCAAAQKESPISFVSLDLDYYSSTKKGLSIFLSSPEKYLPAVMVYVDDIERLLTYNNYCGEMLALTEFNQEHEYRKIERKLVRADRKPQYWHHQIYCCHVLDHPARNSHTNILGGSQEINLANY